MFSRRKVLQKKFKCVIMKTKTCRMGECDLGKKILKFINKLFKNAIFKIVGYVTLVILILTVYGVFNNGLSVQTVWQRILNILCSDETLSIFLAGILSIGIARIVRGFDQRLEEALKTSDDHHGIIRKYNGHTKKAGILPANTLDPEGSFMSVHHIDRSRKTVPKNREKDAFSSNYKKIDEDIHLYKEGALFLPTINVFANLNGGTQLVFRDRDELYKLPDYVITNAEKLLAAHKSSQISNSNTIRLSNIVHNENTLQLHTQRSTYFHMLITNRCMDYDFGSNITLRDLYEYDSRVSYIKHSKLGNQIGINGLILSKDGYILVEKRDYRKTTWKNKFAQSISLALKKSNLTLSEDGIIGGSPDDAQKNFEHIILKTIRANFGLTREDLESFCLPDNFLGLARDLLEGGKPNLYFFVTAKYTAAELAEKLKNAASLTGKDIALAESKLSSDYYLIPFDHICVDYNYAMKIDRRICYWIPRRVYPRTSRGKAFFDQIRRAFSKAIFPVYEKECGEALLVTLSYLEMCRSRIPALKEVTKK